MGAASARSPSGAVNSSSRSPAGTTSSGAATARPDGVRLVLTLPDSEALRGTLTRDWVRPTLSGGKS